MSADATPLTAEELAERSGVDVETVGRYTELGILVPEDGAYPPRDVARIRLARSCERGGVPMDGIAKAIESGRLTFAFLDLPQYAWAPLGERTYEEVGAELGLSVELIQRTNEALGLAPPAAGDLVRDDDLELLRVFAFTRMWEPDDEALLRMIRVYGESLRRIVQAEGTWYRERLERPLLASGMNYAQMMQAASEFGASYTEFMDRAFLHMYHRQQEHAWVDGLVVNIEESLEKMGVHRRLERPPAMCFLDLSGYTRLTEEQGDEAAAELAGALGRLAQGTSQHHGGLPVKWLGDGVMFWFRDPGEAVVAALEMVERTPAAGLPPAHVGLAAGPVVQQDGDYFGRTVNMAARISARAGPSEVLVTTEVVEVSATDGVRFDEVGKVELKGFSAPVVLHRAVRAS
ncbi:MAG: adenylate/guanylate cyclase domain-containing protein [Actinomycetota bacterium]